MRTKRTRLLAILAVLTFALAGCSGPEPRVTQSLPATGITVSWPGAASSLATMESARPETSPGASAPRPTASVAKVITVLTILEKFPLAPGAAGPLLVLDAVDVQRYSDYAGQNGTVLAVYEGMRLTQYEMLQAMLLPSANNIADSMAVWAFGSMESYAVAATAYVRSLGMASTSIGPDASGFSPDTMSTPADLALLARAAMDSAVVAEIVAQPSAVIPGYGPVENTNILLGQDGVVGLKTGTSPEAGGVFLFAANIRIKGRMTLLVGAVMGAGTRAADAMAQAEELLGSIQDAPSGNAAHGVG